MKEPFFPQVAKIVSMDISKTYEELKKLLLENKCRIVEEEPPHKIIVEHGWVFTTSPTKIEKVVAFVLTPVESKTRIVAATSLTTDYKNYIAYSLILNMIFLIYMGMITYFLSELSSKLSVVVSNVGSELYVLYILFFALIVLTIIEVARTIYAYWKRSSFAENILKLLP